MPDFDPTKPYVAVNGHLMVQGGRWSDRQHKMIYSSAWAYCVDSCPACAAGGSPSDYCGEEW